MRLTCPCCGDHIEPDPGPRDLTIPVDPETAERLWLRLHQRGYSDLDMVGDLAFTLELIYPGFPHWLRERYRRRWDQTTNGLWDQTTKH